MVSNISEWIVMIPVLLFAITIHEYSHGKAALSLGDPTAKDAGRLSLNPIIHIDLIGALCLILFHFGWAKPVPVDTRNFKNIRRDTILMSLSGPVANFAAAFVAGLFYRHFPLKVEIYQLALFYLVLFNTALGLFNLLPIPPLDGSHVLENILPPKASIRYREIGRFAPLILFGILMADRFLHIGIVGKLLDAPIRILIRLFMGI